MLNIAISNSMASCYWTYETHSEMEWKWRVLLLEIFIFWKVINLFTLCLCHFEEYGREHIVVWIINENDGKKVFIIWYDSNIFNIFDSFNGNSYYISTFNLATSFCMGLLIVIIQNKNYNPRLSAYFPET